MTAKRTATGLLILGFAAVVVVGFMQAAPVQAELGWATDYKQAIETASKSNKIVMADFTGSDWCGWCMKLKKEVFDTPAFKSWADKNVVLLELDYPRGKQLPAELKQQNKDLMAKYGVEGFPTILFLDAQGNEIARTGYQAGGAGAWIKSAEGAIKAARPKLNVESLANAVAAARKDADNKPLLLIAGDAASEKSLAPLLESPAFVRYANVRLIVGQVKSNTDGLADAKFLAEFKKKLELKDSPLIFAALDAKANKLLYSATTVAEPDKLIDAMEKALPPIAYDGQWIDDYEKARLIAAQRERLLMLDFTGSDWCQWCVKLDSEVFSTDAFKSYAKDNLVLVKLDFPHKKELPAELKAQNQRLLQKLGVRGFPTLILLDATEKKIGQMGYVPGGPEPFLAKLKEAVKSPG